MSANLSSNNSYVLPPTHEELEVTVIGPGFGEAVLIHVGKGKWFLIDSCGSSSSAVPEPLKYLSAIGVDPENVIGVLITHWDDDHCKGVAALVKACAKAKIIMAKAFVEKDFIAYAAAHSSPLTQNVRSGVKELKGVLDHLGEAKRPITAAFPGRRLFTQSDFELDHNFELWTLSPSDSEFDNFLAWVAQQMPQPDETRRVAVKRIRNDLSVVVHTTIGKDVLLFGGDLEEESKADTGWSAILSLAGRPLAKAGVFKIPHHGSETGHHDDVPSGMLDIEPIAIIAPFQNGNVTLPKFEDLDRIRAFAPNAHLTADTQVRANPRRDNAVDKTIREVAIRFSTIRSEPGMVRLRKKIGTEDSWSIEHFGGALPAEKALAGQRKKTAH